jgi:hypothetical protein
MVDITLRRALVSLAAVAGLLVAAGPAAADQGVGSGIASKSQLSSHTGPSTDGIIAVLIGLNHAPAPTGFTPPIGTDKGS